METTTNQIVFDISDKELMENAVRTGKIVKLCYMHNAMGGNKIGGRIAVGYIEIPLLDDVYCLTWTIWNSDGDICKITGLEPDEHFAYIGLTEEHSQILQERVFLAVGELVV